ncbi:MAG: hypothetical protein SGJ09_18270 [Phycisphaerae bacterium]|nr:hypothetical protein [Phycisphaerae bacterium]
MTHLRRRRDLPSLADKAASRLLASEPSLLVLATKALSPRAAGSERLFRIYTLIGAGVGAMLY